MPAASCGSDWTYAGRIFRAGTLAAEVTEPHADHADHLIAVLSGRAYEDPRRTRQRLRLLAQDDERPGPIDVLAQYALT